MPSLAVRCSTRLEGVPSVGRERHWQFHDSESFLGPCDLSRDLALLADGGLLGPRGFSMALRTKQTVPLQEPHQRRVAAGQADPCSPPPCPFPLATTNPHSCCLLPMPQQALEGGLTSSPFSRGGNQTMEVRPQTSQPAGSSPRASRF